MDLEEYAIRLIRMDSVFIILVFSAVMFVGIALSFLTARFDLTLGRIRYLVYSGVTDFCLTLVSLALLDIEEATLDGYLWALWMAIALGHLANGYALGILAMARSRDAYGNRKWAGLIFIPLADCWLYFAPPKQPRASSEAESDWILGGAAGIVFGISLHLLTVAMDYYVQGENDKYIADTVEMLEANEENLPILVERRGIPFTLRRVSENFETPSSMDDVTTLVSVGSDLDAITLTFRVTDEVDNIPLVVEAKVTSNLCDDQSFSFLFGHGVTAKANYVHADGSVVHSFEVDDRSCASSETEPRYTPSPSMESAPRTPT